MLKTILVTLAALLGSGTASAEEADTETPALRGYVGGVRDAAHSRDLQLGRLSIAVALRGAVAETTVEASFLNATGEMLEGDFRFRLPAGAVVTGYALDVGGQMIDGVLVDRPRAKAVYDARVRVRVDPGLAEVAPDNLFQAQVNPILPGRGRTIRLSFVRPVAPGGYRLPIAIAAPAEGWRVAVQASGVDAEPAIHLPGGVRLTPSHTADGYAGAVERTRTPLKGNIAVDSAARPALVVSEHSSGERDVQIGGRLAAGTPARGGTLRVYWDRSRARLDGDPAAAIAVVRQAIDRLAPSSIELVAFNSSGAARTSVASGEAAADWLKTISYRGATSCAPIAHDAPAARCLLFAEGGPAIDRNVAFAPACRLDAVSSTASADTAQLRHVAGSTGGGAYALGARDLAERLAAPASGVVAVVDQDGRSLPFVTLDAPAGRWLALARAPAGGPVVVRLAENGTTRQETVSLAGPAVPFDGVAALIAADQLATLDATEERDAYVAFSRRYGVASPSLSFLVLETAADYLAAKIDPPASFPADARDDYLRARKAADAAQATKAIAWIDDLAAEWA